MVAATPQTSGWRIFRRVLAEQGARRGRLAAILALGILGAPLALVPPLAAQTVVDCYLGEAPLPGFLAALVPGPVAAQGGAVLWLAAALLLGSALIGQALGFARKVVQTTTREELVLGLRRRLFPHVERLSLAYHDDKGASDSTFRVLLDTEVIPAIVLDGAIPLCAAAVQLLVMTVVIAGLSWKLLLVALAVAPLLLFLSLPFGKSLRRQWHAIRALDSRTMGLLQEVFAAVRVVKAFGKESSETDRLVDLARQGMDARVRVSVTQGWFDVCTTLGMAAGTATVLLVGAYQVRHGALSLGELLMVGALLAQLYSPLQLVVGQVASLQSSLAGAERAMKLLDEAPEVVERPDARALVRATGAVTLQDVWFQYRGGEPVLHGVSFAVRAGERIGIAGATGAGKTTLMNLLTRMYDPTRGAILLDGVDLRDLRLADLRRQFAVVLQEPVLFHKSIAENIAYARPEASRAEILAAARLANADGFIAALPEGYDTLVGERGQRLSGGERQRIALARAFLKDTPILILDEPTSSVDMRTEAAILEAVQRLVAGRTTFLIAHRPSTLSGCDKVLVLDHGRIVRFAPPGSAAELGALMLATHPPDPAPTEP